MQHWKARGYHIPSSGPMFLKDGERKQSSLEELKGVPGWLSRLSVQLHKTYIGVREIIFFSFFVSS